MWIGFAPKRFGAWLARVRNTVYQAATDGFACAYHPNNSDINGFTDGSNPPTTKRVANYCGAANHPEGITMPVKKNDYWQVVSTDCTVFWIPSE